VAVARPAGFLRAPCAIAEIECLECGAS
jgi:hypothetical protein